MNIFFCCLFKLITVVTLIFYGKFQYFSQLPWHFPESKISWLFPGSLIFPGRWTTCTNFSKRDQKRISYSRIFWRWDFFFLRSLYWGPALSLDRQVIALQLLPELPSISRKYPCVHTLLNTIFWVSSISPLSHKLRFLIRSVLIGWGCPGLQMVDLSEWENWVWGRERGDRAN